MTDMFRPLTEEEKARKEDRRKRAEGERKAAMKAAKVCIDSDNFKEYRKKLQKAEESTIKQILELRVVDPVKYAFEVHRLANNLRSLRTLLVEVEKEAGE